jgi:hypothetical protein
MGTSKGIIFDIWGFLYDSVIRFPFVLAGALLILGLCKTKYAILLYFIFYFMYLLYYIYGLYY